MRIAPVLALLFCLPGIEAHAQSPNDLPALKGLAPIMTLSSTAPGRAALAANYTVTGALQTGALTQPTLLPFPLEQQLSLRDVFITGANLAQLTDGLGTSLESAYTARAHYTDAAHATSISPGIANLIAYATGISGGNSNSGKYFFANATTNGTKPVSAQAIEILKQNHGVVDPFGSAYGHPAGLPGNDKYGDSRPFQTEPTLAPIAGPDYFNLYTDDIVYNRGPLMDLTNSPSYPSGHTTYGYTGSLLLALLVPERYQQMITRGAEYGNNRILVGAHYAMDVLGGRTLALYDMAHLLANDPAYVGQSTRGAQTITDFPAALKAARNELTAILELACNDSIANCARQDRGRFSNPAANHAFYESTQTYNLGVVYSATATTSEDVSKLAPEAGYLLTFALPKLTLEQADKILTETEGPGGGFLDDGAGFGVYSRLDLYAAFARAQQVSAGQ